MTHVNQMPKYKDLKTTKFHLTLFDIIIESDYTTGEFVRGKCVNYDGNPTGFFVTRSTCLDRDVLLVVAHGVLVNDSVAEIPYDDSFENYSFGVDVNVSKPKNKVRLDFIIFDKYTRKILGETFVEYTDSITSVEDVLPKAEVSYSEYITRALENSTTTTLRFGIFTVYEIRHSGKIVRAVTTDGKSVPDGVYVALERDCEDIKYVDIVNISDGKTYLTYRADLVDHIKGQN